MTPTLSYTPYPLDQEKARAGAAIAAVAAIALVAGVGAGKKALPVMICAGDRVTLAQAEAAIGEVHAARIARDRALQGGSLYAAGKVAVAPGSREAAGLQAAEARLKRAQAAARKVCSA
jgi:hypothetical protein